MTDTTDDHEKALAAGYMIGWLGSEVREDAHRVSSPESRYARALLEAVRRTYPVLSNDVARALGEEKRDENQDREDVPARSR